MRISVFVISFLFGFIGWQSAIAKGKTQDISVVVTEKGFEPNEINVKPGEHVVLKVTRKTESTCATQIIISDKKIKKDLPLDKEVTVDLGTLQKGEVRFACGMDMISGQIIVK